MDHVDDRQFRRPIFDVGFASCGRLSQGRPAAPNAPWGIKSSVNLPQDRLKATLHLAEEGPWISTKAIWRGASRRCAGGGGALSLEDALPPLARHGREAALRSLSRGARSATPPRSLPAARPWRIPPPAAAEPASPPMAARTQRPTRPMPWHCNRPYRERLRDMGDADGQRALGAEHLAPACTTHFQVVDREGNMAAVDANLVVDVRLEVPVAAKRGDDE